MSADVHRLEALQPPADSASEESSLEQALKFQIGARNPAALEFLYDLTRVQLHAVARLHVASDAAATRVVAAVYADLWKVIESDDRTRQGLMGWLLARTESLAIEHSLLRAPAQRHAPLTHPVRAATVMH